MNNGFLSFFICMIGLIALLAALPLYFQKIRPNGFYGIRVPKALESEEAWYSINLNSAVTPTEMMISI